MEQFEKSLCLCDFRDVCGKTLLLIDKNSQVKKKKNTKCTQ